MTEKKPDLSDLKARLGLNKPGAAPPPGAGPPPGSSSPGPGSAPQAPFGSAPAPTPQAVQQAPQAPQAPAPFAPAPTPAPAPAPAPQAPAPQSFAPPVAPAQAPPASNFGPPAAASRPAPQASAPKPKPAPVPVMTAAPDLSVGNDMDAAPVFTKGVIGLFGACLVAGLVFGYGLSTTMYTNEIDSARTADAERILGAVKPKVDAFREALPKMMAISETSADFEAVKNIGTDFVLDGNPLGAPRLLIGQPAIDSVTSYVVESQLLHAMLKEHDRITTTVDKEELEKLAEDNKILENDFFGVTFDYVYALKNGGSENYVPKEGQFVIGRGPAEDVTKFKVEYPGTGRVDEVPLQAYIPIGKQQIVRSSGQNALTRYQWRVRQIKFQAAKMEKTLDGVSTSLQSVIEGG